MSTSKDVTIWCDGEVVDCFDWAKTDPSPDTDVARKAARARGWKYVDGLDLCPRCLKAREEA